MLTRETFVDAIGKVKKHEELMERLDSVCREFGSFRPSLIIYQLLIQRLVDFFYPLTAKKPLRQGLSGFLSPNHRPKTAYSRHANGRGRTFQLSCARSFLPPPAVLK